MNRLNIGGKREDRTLNGHVVTVILPKMRVSYEEGIQRIDRIIEEAKKRQKPVSQTAS